MSIPTGNLFFQSAARKFAMDKFALRRERFIELMNRIEEAGRGQIARFAARIEKDASWVLRATWPADKKGRKRIGDDIARELEGRFKLPPFYFDSTDALMAVPDEHDEELITLALSLHPDIKRDLLASLRAHKKAADTLQKNVRGTLNAPGDTEVGEKLHKGKKAKA